MAVYSMLRSMLLSSPISATIMRASYLSVSARRRRIGGRRFFSSSPAWRSLTVTRMTSARGLSGGASSPSATSVGSTGPATATPCCGRTTTTSAPAAVVGPALASTSTRVVRPDERVGPGARHLPHHVDGLAAVLLHHDRDLGVADEATGEKDDELLLELRGRHVGALHPADEGEGEGAVGLHEEGLGEVRVPVDGDAQDVGGADLVVGLARERGGAAGAWAFAAGGGAWAAAASGARRASAKARVTRLMGGRYTLRKHVRPSVGPTGAVATRRGFSGWGSPRCRRRSWR